VESSPSPPTPEHPADRPENRPVLAIDVDGVLSLFGFDAPPTSEAVRFELIDGTPHFISIAAAERVRRLCRCFDPVWATGWQERANDRLSLITGIGPLPVIEFDPRRESAGTAGTTAAHWKVPAIDAYCGDRPLAWIDDSFDQSCFEWADSREEAGSPTLLVPTEPMIGLEEAQASVISDWADSLNGTPRPFDHLH